MHAFVCSYSAVQCIRLLYALISYARGRVYGLNTRAAGPGPGVARVQRATRIQFVCHCMWHALQCH